MSATLGRMVGLADPLRGVCGGRTAQRLEAELGLRTVGDLLHLYPRRYYRRGELTDLAELPVGEHVTILARVERVHWAEFRNRATGRKGMRQELTATDGHGHVKLTFFNQRWMGQQLVGRVGMFSGQVKLFAGKRELVHPQMHLLGERDDAATIDAWAGGTIAVYPANRAVGSDAISKAVDTVLPLLDDVADPIPDAVRRRHGLIDLTTALHSIHRPRTDADAEAARRRLIFEEAFVLQATLAHRRQHADALTSAVRPGMIGGLLDRFDARLGYELTPGQHEVGGRIADDLARPRPMHRLLQGDVGTGKTLVALRAMLQVVDSGGQAVLLAPTEVLAQQHHASIVALLGPLAEGGMLGGDETATRVALLTGSTTAKERRSILADIASGAAGIVVGTHALLQGTVGYCDLGLIVVDEQHRFGVEQRSALLDRIPGQRPHLLVMTATPIPRTVAMTVFGDLDVSTLTQRPLGDPRISTHVVSEIDQLAHLRRAWVRVREEVAARRQVFVVCARIDESDADESAATGDPALDGEALPGALHALETLVGQLSHGPLAGVRIGVLHGRLSADEKADVMRRFARGPADPAGLDVLASTTVIEVGIDVPEASMMVIMDAERFGISQVHQLRGRIGRAGQPAVCLLVTRAPKGHPAYERLGRIAATNDGFALARLDLEQRREGDVLGVLQSGHRSSLRLLSVIRDETVIEQARNDVADIFAQDPALAAHPALAAAVAAIESGEQADYLERA